MSDVTWLALNFIGGLVVGALIWRWGYREGRRDGYAMRRED